MYIIRTNVGHLCCRDASVLITTRFGSSSSKLLHSRALTTGRKSRLVHATATRHLQPGTHPNRTCCFHAAAANTMQSRCFPSVIKNVYEEIKDLHIPCIKKHKRNLSIDLALVGVSLRHVYPFGALV